MKKVISFKAEPEILPPEPGEFRTIYKVNSPYQIDIEAPEVDEAWIDKLMQVLTQEFGRFCPTVNILSATSIRIEMIRPDIPSAMLRVAQFHFLRATIIQHILEYARRQGLDDRLLIRRNADTGEEKTIIMKCVEVRPLLPYLFKHRNIIRLAFNERHQRWITIQQKQFRK
jgi:hypothetical protein